MKCFLTAVALVISACGASVVEEVTAPPDATATSVTASTSTTASRETTTTEGREQPSAPDFSLEMGDGGTFTLSEETRPIYLVFWAEW